MWKSFTLKLAMALVVGLAIAVIVAPFAALIVAEAGFRYPFPRIFDRVVMVALFAIILIVARPLRLLALLGAGFGKLRGATPLFLRGFGVAIVVIAAMVVAALAIGAGFKGAGAIGFIPKYLASAIAVGILEEAFFRAFLFGGMEGDFGRTGAIIGSSAIYALAHLVRSPARFYVASLELGAGLRTLAGSGAQFTHPATAIPTLIGLFLLGIVLAEAYVITGSVYFSVGLHAGFVLGAKMWSKLLRRRAMLPGWLVGWGRQPLIGGVCAWVAAILILAALPSLTGTRRERTSAVSAASPPGQRMREDL